jgi:hypothetical protein
MGESAIGMGYPGTLAWPYYSPVAYTVQHERIPLGEVEVRRGEPVHAEGGVVGRVEGLVVDHTSLSKRDINALPEIEVARHGEGAPTRETPEG